MSEKQKIVHSILAAFEYLVFVGCLCVGVAVSYANALEIGDSLPALTVTGEGGERISLDDYSGKVVYLDVWASWCKTCRHSLPWMDGLQRRFGSQGLQILAVNVDEDPKDAQKFLESSEVKLLVGYDPGGKIPAALRVQTMPTSYLIGRDGKLKAIHGGLNDERMKEIEKEIEELISQKGEGVMFKEMILILGVVFIAFSAFGCAEVQVWERGNLAKPHMAFDPDPLEKRFMQHVHESKTASSGGYGVGGGGCGCN